MDRISYAISKEVKQIIEYMLAIKENDLPEFCLLRDELKSDVGKEFYEKHFKEHFEI